MQDRYVGDFGDFVKLALLRALSPGYELGVVWYRVVDEFHNGDGRHIHYLGERHWPSLDPDLFKTLSEIVKNGKRSLDALEQSGLLPNCSFVSSHLVSHKIYSERRPERTRWITEAAAKVKQCNLVFLDPDNGLEPQGFSYTRKKSIKSASFDDLQRLRQPGRTLVLYHHQTRRTGGHLQEIDYHAGRLLERGFEMVGALRSRHYSARAFFLLDADESIRHRAKEFVEKWAAHGVTWHASTR